MAVKSKDEILESLKSRIGEDTTDEAISILEDVEDTLNSLTNTETENWKQKYEENDAQWRQRYKDRFFSKGDTEDVDKYSDEEPVADQLTYDKLFEEGK